MYCVKCKSENIRVLDSRSASRFAGIRRRRKCEDCGFRFTTYEIEEASLKSLEERDALLRGLRAVFME